jgi:hypothetical protein
MCAAILKNAACQPQHSSATFIQEEKNNNNNSKKKKEKEKKLTVQPIRKTQVLYQSRTLGKVGFPCRTIFSTGTVPYGTSAADPLYDYIF